MAPKKKLTKEEAKAPTTKRKAEETKAAPVAKETKKEEPKKAEPKKEEPKLEPTKEEPKVEEEKGEKEKDAPKDNRKVLTGTVGFDPVEATLNVVPTLGGKMLMTLSDGGMQFLIGGARSNTGIKAGRYAYEVKAVQTLAPFCEKGFGKAKPPAPRQLLRVGFSVGASSLLLGDGEGSISFDADGQFNVNGVRSPSVKFMERDAVICVMVNLDQKSPNANTVSLFKNGERLGEPKELPDNLKGKALFPHVSFRNISLNVNFGPSLMKELPFKCRTVQGAAASDCEVNPITPPKDGKYEVVLPVGFPNEGTFDWLDLYLKDNPKYVELSDRTIQDWAKKSGVWQNNRWHSASSRDKPEYAYGLPNMDDLSVPRLLKAVAPVVPRDFIVMEVKSNLLADERKTTLKRFNYPCFKKVAHVVMGQPSNDFKKVVHSKLLKVKQDKANAAWKVKQLEKNRKKQIAERQKQLKEAAQKKKEEEEAKAAKKKEEEDKKVEDLTKDEPKAEDDEKKDEEAKTETKEEEKEKSKEEVKEETNEGPKDEEKKDEPMEEEEETEPPAVELDEEEEKVMFFPAGKTPDLTDYAMNASFGHFTIPEKDEGFDLIRYEWQGADESKDYLKKWVLERKLMTKVDNLKPGEGFKKTMTKFDKLVKEWQELQKAHKAKRTDKPKDDAVDDDDKTVDDIFAVADVKDIGGGEPLFANFEPEDWALMTMRVELYYLVAGFKADTNDSDRAGIHQTLMAHYYTLYHNKLLNPKTWGSDQLVDMLSLVKDTVEIELEQKIITTVIKEEPENFDLFVKLTEENRRERQRRIDAGDETARLKYIAPTAAEAKASGNGKSSKGSYENDKGNDKGGNGWNRGGKSGKDYGSPRASPYGAPRSAYGGKSYGKASSEPLAP